MKVNAEFLKKVMNCGDENTEIAFEIENFGNAYLAKSILLGTPACANINISNVLLEPDDEGNGGLAFITLRLGSFVDCTDRKNLDEIWKEYVLRQYRLIYGKEQDNK